MPVTIKATPGAADANSYGTEAEAVAYFSARLPLDTPWSSVADQTAALAMACRVLEQFAGQRKTLILKDDGKRFYRTTRTWTGTVSTLYPTSALSWPREGMFDRLGRAIANNVVPQDLKNAQFELAGQLAQEDTTLDNAVAVGGITSVKAGSVALTFKQMIDRHVLPDAVLELLVPSWLTDELISAAFPFGFDAIPQDCDY